MGESGTQDSAGAPAAWGAAARGADWLDRLAVLWARERRAHEQRFAEDMRQHSLRDRALAGIALRALELDEFDATAGGRTLLWLRSRKLGDLAAFRLQPGDPVRLWTEAGASTGAGAGTGTGTGPGTGPFGPGALRATLARRQGERVAVILDQERAEDTDGDLDDLLAGAPLHLDRDMPVATFARGAAAIVRFRRIPERDTHAILRDVLVGRAAPRPAAPEPFEPLDAALDPSQRDAVALALGCRELALVHGPPGTGKTRTLVELIRQLVARGARVLATAASNTAVDNLAERLVAAGVDAIRLGHPARVAPEVEGRTLDVLLRRHPDASLARRWLGEASALRRTAGARRARGTMDRAAFRQSMAEARQLTRDARRLMAQAQAGLLRRAPVLCATAAGADAAVLGDQRFDWVILDEATQAPDPIALVALARASRAVLAGDPHQLPPTVVDPDAARDGLATTFFERLLAAAPGAGCMLRVQYRMHADIMAFPSQRTYGGQLAAAPAVAGHTLADLGVAGDALRPGAFVFLDTAGKGWQEERDADDASTRNPGQAARVAAELRRLLGRGVDAAQVAVIATYRAQVRELRALLADELARGLEVATVDGFQGREKEVVIVDLVRSNDIGDIGFLRDTRRMNVAITRARRLLLVVGDSATVGSHPYYADFLAHAEQSGAWLSAWSDEAPPFEP